MEFFVERIIKMKKRNIRYLKDPVVTVLLMISFILSFFLVLNGLHMYQNIKTITTQKQEEKYVHQYALTYYPPSEYTESEKKEEEFTGFIPYLECEHGNITLHGLYGIIGEAYQEYPLEIVLASKETIKYKMAWGEVSWEPYTVVIDKTMESECIKKEDGLYISIEEEWYKVTGEFNDSPELGEDSHVLLTYDSISRELVKTIYKNLSQIGFSYQIIYETDGNLEKKDISKLEQWAEQWLSEGLEIGEIVGEEDEVKEVVSTTARNMALTIVKVLFCFSILNCMVVTDLWVKRRKREFIIRKAFGENNLQIMKHLFKDLGVFAGTSCVLVLILEMIFYQIRGEKFMDLNNFLFNIISVFGIICIIIVVTLILPMRKIMKIEPAIGIGEE